MRLPEKVAVIGAGALGRAIALACAGAGFSTILEDILPATLRSAHDHMQVSLRNGDRSDASISEILARVEFAASVEQAARAADFVIEAVPDEWESKLEIAILLDKLSRPGTIIALSTALSVTDLASSTYRAPLLVGLRFSNPVYGHGALEIVRGGETIDATVAAAAEIGRRMGKPVTVTSGKTAVAAQTGQISG